MLAELYTFRFWELGPLVLTLNDFRKLRLHCVR